MFVVARFTVSEFDNMEAVATARVPILKLRHRETGVECDICVNHTLPVYNSYLIKMYCAVDTRVRPLVLLVGAIEPLSN